MTNLDALLQEITKGGGISVYYQPIFDMGGEALQLFAIEAFSRGAGGESAAQIFEHVRAMSKEIEIDRSCVVAILSSIHIPARRVPVSINVHTTTIEHDPSFPEFVVDLCRFYRVPPSNIIVEVVGDEDPSAQRQLLTSLELLRAAGMRIAIGSIGLTISNFKTLLEAKPDFYKIDRTLVSGVNKWTSSQDAIESIAMLALRRGGRAIAVGVQTPEELQTIHALGVELVQGFYFGEPWAAERLLRPTIEKKEGH